ncbi:MAG: cytochrome c biogenesis protein CcsA [Bdellovibrio sp.]|nr:cytochrome c biogenesis protein CcsA [Bdellovibrio sp.]
MKIFIFCLIMILTSSTAWSNDVCSEDLGPLPTLTGGRVKPLYVHAQEFLKFVTSKRSFGNMNAAIVYCYLSLGTSPQGQELKLTSPIGHVKLKKFLSLDENANEIATETLVAADAQLRQEYQSESQRTEPDESYKNEIGTTLSRIELYKNVKDGTDWTIPTEVSGELKWVSIKEFAPTLSQDPSLAVKLQEAKALFIKKQTDHYLLELLYAKAHLFSWAMLTTLLAMVAFVLLKRNLWGNILTFLSIGLELAAMTLRSMISGRAPITNMYETVMFSGFGALLLATIVSLVKKEKIYMWGGLGYNFLCLFMMMFANNMLDSSIAPLVPVLRDNFWLSTHVCSIMLSYGALALSWILANIMLVRMRFFTISSQDVNYYTKVVHTCLKYGVVLLAAGIILGGIWADYSWGRFWGWDPKETWSLITLCVYMVILHGRYTSWISPSRFILVTAGAFMSVMMAWFGVNYILASGLHSYGFSTGGALFLGMFFAIQISVMVICGLGGPKKAIS